MDEYIFIAEIEDYVECEFEYELSDETYQVINEQLDDGAGLEDVDPFDEYQDIIELATDILWEKYSRLDLNITREAFDELVEDEGIKLYPGWR